MNISTTHPLPATRPSILIVDDDQQVQSVLTEILSEHFDCRIASSAFEARELLGRERFQLVLLDINMPGPNGLDFLAQITGLRSAPTVVMISASPDLESPIEAMRRGAYDYLPKPFGLNQVMAVVERALEHQTLREMQREYSLRLERMVEERTARLAEDARQIEEQNRRIKGMYETLYENYRATLRSLAKALEARDAETRGHSDRVVAYCLKLGQQLGLTDRELLALEQGALLHDIGKIGTPDGILLKAGTLTEEEWLVMRQHIDHGAAIVSEVELLSDALWVIQEHHEKWDGSGYPQGLKGEEISIYARIFAVADCADAITSDRPYREGRPFEAVIEELTICAGTHFDPRVVEAFVSVPLDEWRALREAVQSGHNPFAGMQRRAMLSLLEARIHGDDRYAARSNGAAPRQRSILIESEQLVFNPQ
ncbi:MAG TPA: HD domain-containing phosphohydrolase [Blastocatellia bacterium]|nr:HD domain-containing phosphohydrolase [Blastocatellia bacterium]